MPNQQKYRPISFRPPEADRLWLLEHAKATGQAINHVLVAALVEYRARHERALARSHLRPSPIPAAEDEQPQHAGTDRSWESAAEIARRVTRLAEEGKQ